VLGRTRRGLAGNKAGSGGARLGRARLGTGQDLARQGQAGKTGRATALPLNLLGQAMKGILTTLAASAAIFGLFGLVQTIEYRDLEARYHADLVRAEALALENERLRWDLGEARRQRWDFSHFTGNLPSDVQDIVHKEAVRQGIDPALVMAVIAQESGGRKDARSKVGALGLMQLMPATAKDLKVDPQCPKQNVKGGVRYLKRLIAKYGDIELALQAYNWGPANLDAYLSTGKGKRGQDMPEETRKYADGVLNRIVRVDLLAQL